MVSSLQWVKLYVGYVILRRGKQELTPSTLIQVLSIFIHLINWESCLLNAHGIFITGHHAYFSGMTVYYNIVMSLLLHVFSSS